MVTNIWDERGLIPPIDQQNPTSNNRSPYKITIFDFIDIFGFSQKRLELLDSFLDFQKKLLDSGLLIHKQWINGSFCEHCEMTRNRSPNDIDAVCAINFDNHSFSFKNNNEVKTALSHLDIAKKLDEDVELNVMFLGVLPNKRKCEFRLKDDDNVYVASIDKKIKDPELINKHLGSYTNVYFKTSQIENKPKKYLLLDIPTSW